MTDVPGWRPEHTLMAAALVLAGSFLLAAVVVAAGVMQERRIEAMVPYGLAVAGAGAVAAVLIGAWGRRLRRRQRPQWLETQAWRSGLEEKLARGRAREAGAGQAPEKDED